MESSKKSISAFDIIKIGIGPSSSHTMGPWKAASFFIEYLKSKVDINLIQKIQVNLYGSLALTGIGHGTDIAILMGLSGEDFKSIDTTTIDHKVDKIKSTNQLKLEGKFKIPFSFLDDIIFRFGESLAFHANGMEFVATLKSNKTLAKKYYSVGGGFLATDTGSTIENKLISTKYPCHKAIDIINNCEALSLSISDLVLINEQAWRSKKEIVTHALNIWSEIKDCIYRGISTEGILPGGLNVKRRAFDLNRSLLSNQTYKNRKEWIHLVKSSPQNFSTINKWISCFALAVNEENADFGRIITAPTNGAAGVIPAVLMYAYCFNHITKDAIVRFLVTAGEIGTLFKKNATISAAMGGCQAEIGVSSSMAAGALTEIMGGTPQQVLMAAEIAMEHHLGLTCDPIGGLVQIPCIERNTMGSIKAITASNIALESDPKDARVSLDEVIQTMWETALDMNHKYKETAQAGLATNIAVSVVEC